MSIQKLLYNEFTRQYELLLTPVCLLSLKIRGSKIGKIIQEVLKELRKKKLFLKPTFYVSDEFGCVEETTNIGIPFYFVDPEIEELNKRFGSEKHKPLGNYELKALLRHECGHAFFYAYSIMKNNSARKLFGEFSSKHVSLKNINPNSIDFVDYLAGWDAASSGYSQTHPEEDIADTFGAWLDPLENKSAYTGKALKKLQLIDKLVLLYIRKKPRRLRPELHKPHTSIKETLESFFRRHFGPFDLEFLHRSATGYMDQHLRKVFSVHIPTRKENRLYAFQFLERNRKWIIRQTKRWGKNPSYLNHLIQKAIERSKALHLVVPVGNIKKARKIFCAMLVLMATLLEENGRLD